MPKRDTSKQLINSLRELMAAAALVKEKTIEIENICREQMENIDSSPIPKDLSKVVAEALAKSAARRKRP
jgi:hypothetical protein